MKLSELIRDEIDGAIESQGRDGQLTEWCEMAERLEHNSARYLWLRDEMGITLDLGHGKLGNKVHPTQLDAAIDRAMREWVQP